MATATQQQHPPRSKPSSRPPNGTPTPASLPARPPRPHHGSRSKPSTPAPDESPEIRALRNKYRSELSTLSGIFPDWPAEDLLSLLSEVNGSVDVAATRISEGQAVQWGAVTHKKDKKGQVSSNLALGQGLSRDGTASPGRGGFRGGRGGGMGGRGGGRGGRGGGRGGLNGHSTTHPSTTEGASTEASTPADSSETKDAAPVTSPSDTKPEAHESSTKEAPGPKANGAPAVQAPVPQRPAVVAPTVQKMSWAQIAKPKAKPVPPPAPPVAAPPPAPPAEPEPTPAEESPSTETTTEEVSKVTTDAPPEPDSISATTDEWVVVPAEQEPAPAPEPAEVPAVTLEKTPEPAPAEPAVVAPVPAPESTPSAPPPPPGLSPSTATLTSLSTSVPSTTTPSTSSTATTPVTKPSGTPRLASHRTAARFKTDAPVVMPGNIGIGAGALGGLSFGTGVIGSGLSPGNAFDSPRLGMQFGSLSLAGDDELESVAAKEPPAVASEPVAQPEPEPTPVEVPAPEPVPAPSAIPTQQAPVSTPQPTETTQPSISNLNNLYQQTSSTQAVPQQVSPAPQPSTTNAQFSTVTSVQQPQPQQSQPPQAQPSSQPTTIHAPGLQQPLHASQQQQPQPQHLHQLHQPSPAPSHLPQSASSLASQQQQPLQGYQGGSHNFQPYLDSASHQVSSQVPSQQSLPHPAQAAQSSHFRTDTASPYFHTPPPQSQQSSQPSQSLPPSQQSQEHMNPYNSFSPLGLGPGGAPGGQASHLGGFGSATGEYGGYGDSRSFYDSYNQSGFQNRNTLGHDELSKGALSGPAQGNNTGLSQQQSASLNPGQSTTPQGGGQQFPGMMPPYHYPYQSYYGSYAGFTPYGAPPHQVPFAKYGHYQQPPGPGPVPHQQNASKPPGIAAAASPYGSQSHLHYGGGNVPYDDSATGGYQQSSNSEYGQKPLYGSGIQNFFNQGAQGGGAAGQPMGAGAGAASVTPGQPQRGAGSSPENAYKGYGGGPGGVGGPDKGQQQQGQQGRGAGVAGGPNAQQGFYQGRYSSQPQPPTQGYAQGDQQFYGSYQQPGRYWAS